MALAKMNARSFCNCSFARLEAGSTPRHCRTAQCLAGGEERALPEGVGGVKQHHNGDNHDWNLWTLHQSLAIAVPTALLLLGPPAQAQTGYTATRHPIVLVHGLFGFDSVLGIDYFYGIPDALRQSGAKVYVAQVSAANSTEVRGEQLLAQVKTSRPCRGPANNLIGHSHGGPTIRYVAGVAPQLRASATSVAGVNRGSRVADIVRGVAPAGSVSETVANTAATALVGMINLLWRHRLATDAHGSAGFPHPRLRQVQPEISSRHPGGLRQRC